MNKKTTLVLIILTGIALGIGSGIGVYYFLSKNNQNNYSLPENNIPPGEQATVTKLPTTTLQGIIKLFPDKNIVRAVLQTDDKKEYLIWPSYSASFYDGQGIKNNQRVQITGSIFEESKFYLKKIERI